MNCVSIFFTLTFISATFSMQPFSHDPFNVIAVYHAVIEMVPLILGKTGDDYENEFHQEGRYERRVQQRISIDVPFPCNVTGGRSRNVPKSVHELRPGDIDVVAAMGDSLTAGSGIFATNILHLAIENRGVTALGGGQATWREYITVPNIIKEFNPNLIGYSPYDSSTYKKASSFNVAATAAMSRDLPYMAKNLIRRMKSHPDVDFKNHWKLISIFIGCNDFCSEMCWTKASPSTVLNNHRNDLIETLRIYRDNLPRVLISLIPPPNLMILNRMRDKSMFCQLVTDVSCSCLTGPKFRSRDAEFAKTIAAWQRIDEEVANYPEFQTDEFAVVMQPFTINMTFPLRPGGAIDWRYLSVDCFHLSQIGNARAARAIWKNMLQPVGRKSHEWDDSESIFCPNESHPYITTLINSQREFA